jgi:hypothetical protein
MTSQRLLVLYAHNNLSIYFFLYTMKKDRIVQWILAYILLNNVVTTPVVNNITMYLMALLNMTDSKNSWLLYQATLLLLLLAIDNKSPHGLLLWPGTIDMILHHGSSVTQLWKTTPLEGTVTMLANCSLASASAALLVNCCCVAAYTK